MRRRGARRSTAAVACALVSMLALSGCGVVEDTLEGLTGTAPSHETPRPAPSGSAHESEAPDGEQIVIEVRFESDGATAADVVIEVESTTSPQSFRDDLVDLPFQQEFRVDTGKPFPFRNVTATADAADGATYISCEIIIDGESVASHRSTGGNARAECERGLRLGPS